MINTGKDYFQNKLKQLNVEQSKLILRKNNPETIGNGIFKRWEYPILTAKHTPLFWRYDLNEATNPRLLERQGINSTFNAGTMSWKGKYLVVARVEGFDRKSFFGIAESPNGVDHFQFWDYPMVMPETEIPETNVYDMRLVRHEDGWIYGLFCAERKDKNNPHLLNN